MAVLGGTRREYRRGHGRRSLPTARAIVALMLREMTTSYGRSPGGYLWAVLEPTLGIALLTLIFSVGFRAPPVGTSFPLFYATGMVPFLFYGELSSKVAQAILYSRQLLAYPGVTYADALLARFLVAALTQILVACLVLAGIFAAFDTRTTPDIAAAVLGFAMASALGLGVGTLNCFLMTRYALWQRVWSIVNRPLFLLSCVFFTFDTVPEPYRSGLWFNPLVHVVGQMRAAFYPAYDGTYVSPLYVFAVSLCLTASGLVFLRRFHRELVHD